MLLTDALKKFLRDHCGVAATATDDDYRKAATEALMKGTLTAVKMAELSADTATEAENRLKTLVASSVAQELPKALAGIDWKTLVGGIAGATAGGAPAATVPPTPTPASPPPTPAPTTPEAKTPEIGPLIRQEIVNALKDLGVSPQTSPHHLLTRGLDSKGGVLEAHSVSVKAAFSAYDNTKSVATYSPRCLWREKAGQPIEQEGRVITRPSQAEKAVVGAYAKWAIGAALNRAGQGMSDHDKDLLEYAVRELPWTGFVKGDGDGHTHILIDRRKLNEMEQKALLNDAVSGGVNAVPVVYDDAAITVPLETGELYPLVKTIPLARGRIVRAFSMGVPTISSGVPEGTAIPLFDTTGFIAGLDTTIYPCVGAIEIGLDFEEDSPTNFGQYVIDRYGEVHLQWLDEQIALGDGTTEPLGIFNTGSMTLVPSANGVDGPLTLGDLEALIFGVARAYRRSAGGRMVFIMSDVSYRRFRAIATATGWNTRLFGTNYEDYTVLGYPVRIGTNVPNNKIAFVNLAYYNLYRRQGLAIRVTTDGKELTLKNLRLITVRALWGGRLMQGGAGALMVDAQA